MRRLRPRSRFRGSAPASPRRAPRFQAFAWRAAFAVVAVLLGFAGGGTAHAEPGARRLRLGIEAGLGPSPGAAGGASAAAFGQLGLQLGRQFAVFYQPSFALQVSGGNDAGQLFRGSSHLLMTDVTFGPFQLGVGAGLRAQPGASCSGNASCADAARSVVPLVGGRFAILVALPGLRGRWGVPLAANLHVSEPASHDRAAAIVFTIGLERY